MDLSRGFLIPRKRKTQGSQPHFKGQLRASRTPARNRPPLIFKSLIYNCLHGRNLPRHMYSNRPGYSSQHGILIVTEIPVETLLKCLIDAAFFANRRRVPGDLPASSGATWQLRQSPPERNFWKTRRRQPRQSPRLREAIRQKTLR